MPVKRPPATSINQIYWLAGLLEGEGSFVWSRKEAMLQIAMTDKGPIQRVAALFGTKINGPYRNKTWTTKMPIWKTSLHGSVAVGWMMTLFVLLSPRRQEKIKEIIRKWRVIPARPYIVWTNASKKTLH